MARSRRLLVALTGLVLSVSLIAQTGMTAQAGSNRNYLDSLNGGVAAILDPSATNATEIAKATVRKYSVTEEVSESTRVMANVKKALNLRSEANENAEKVGKLYKDCGGTILERKDGWTRLQSGNVIGWAKDEYLLFGDEAEALANSVGKMIAQMSDALRVRKEPSKSAEVLGILPKGEIVEVISDGEDGWLCIDYE